MLKQFGLSPNEIYQEDFLKVPVLNLYERSNPVGHPVHSLLSAESKYKWNS